MHKKLNFKMREMKCLEKCKNSIKTTKKKELTELLIILLIGLKKMMIVYGDSQHRFKFMKSKVLEKHSKLIN